MFENNVTLKYTFGSICSYANMLSKNFRLVATGIARPLFPYNHFSRVNGCLAAAQFLLTAPKQPFPHRSSSSQLKINYASTIGTGRPIPYKPPSTSHNPPRDYNHSIIGTRPGRQISTRLFIFSRLSTRLCGSAPVQTMSMPNTHGVQVCFILTKKFSNATSRQATSRRDE